MESSSAFKMQRHLDSDVFFFRRIQGQMHMEIETELQSANQLINLCDRLQSVTYLRFSSHATLGKSASISTNVKHSSSLFVCLSICLSPFIRTI